jgi:hypothetical protein
MIDFRIDGNMKDSVSHEINAASVCEAKKSKGSRSSGETRSSFNNPCEPIEGY